MGNPYIILNFALTLLVVGYLIIQLFKMRAELNVKTGEVSEYLARLEETSQLDELTGLRNVRFFKDALGREFSRSYRYGDSLGCLILDLDNFKDFNERFGKQAGDALIREVGWVCRRTTRRADIVTRYGADIFAILLPETNQADGFRVAEKIKIEVDAVLKSRMEEDFSITVSLGISAFESKNDKYGIDTEEILVEKAFEALRQGKSKGGNAISGCPSQAKEPPSAG